jgi:hypothetical protein
MKLYITMILLLFGISSLYGENTIVPNPIQHFLDYHNHINKNHKVLFFEVDVNNDKKPDLFVSSDNPHLFNGQQGRIYFVYLTENNKYYWEDDNNITLRYNKLIFNNMGHYQDMAPLILLEEDSIWACSYKNNIKNVYELLDITWGKHHHAADIFHDILEKSHAESHPLIVLDNNKAVLYWTKQLQ